MVAAVWFLLLVLGGRDGAAAVVADLKSSWEYQLQGGDEEETRHRFLERYYLSTGFSFQPTDAITAGANLAYTRFHISDRGTNETLTPTANFSLSNDIFVAAWNGTWSRNRLPSSATLDTYSWGASLSSAWQRPLWPTLKFYYDESGSNSDEQGLDLAEASYGSDLTWILPGANFFYGYNQRHFEDRLNLNQVDTTSHTARLETGGDFWDRRFSVKLVEAFTATTTDFRIGLGGDIDVPLELATFAVVNANPALIDLPVFPAATPITVAFQEAGHLGLEGIFDAEGEQQLNQLRVTVDEATALRVEDGEVDLTWALYISRDNLIWELVPGQGSVLPRFDSLERRFEIDIPTLEDFPTYDFLKAVAINRDSVEVTFLSLQGVRIVSQSESGDQTSYQTDLTVAHKIFPSLTATSRLNLVFFDETITRSLHGNLRWSPSPKAGLSLGFSEDRQQSESRPDQIQRSYSVTVPTSPLPTLQVTPGASRAESFEGSRRTSVADNFTLNSTAFIYPDLTAALALAYALGEREAILGQEVKTENYSARVTFIARLSRKWNAELTHEYLQTILPAEDTSQDTTLNLVYRPSDLLVTRLLATKRWTGEAPARIDFRLDLALLRTHKTRVNFNYRHIHDETDTDTFGLLGSWDISQVFTLQSQARYLLAEPNSWGFNLKLLMNL